MSASSAVAADVRQAPKPGPMLEATDLSVSFELGAAMVAESQAATTTR